MVSMTNWIKVFKRLGCPLSRKELRTIIVSRFLIRPGKCLGGYLVDGDALWNYIIKKYPECEKEAQKLRLKSPISVESWIDELEYRNMRSTYPRNMHKKIGL